MGTALEQTALMHTTPMDTTLSRLDTPLAFESLPTARGLRWKDGFRGYLNTGERVAQVRLDGLPQIQILGVGVLGYPLQRGEHAAVAGR